MEIEKVKENVKGFKINNPVRVVAMLSFGMLPDGEMKVLEVLVKYSAGNSIGLGLEIVKELRREAGLSESNFSTCIHRLVKKGVISKDGKTVVLHPKLSGVLELDKIVLVINKETA